MMAETEENSTAYKSVWPTDKGYTAREPINKGDFIIVEPSCDCECHLPSELRTALSMAEEKIGIIKCLECACWD